MHELNGGFQPTIEVESDVDDKLDDEEVSGVYPVPDLEILHLDDADSNDQVEFMDDHIEEEENQNIVADESENEVEPVSDDHPAEEEAEAEAKAEAEAEAEEKAEEDREEVNVAPETEVELMEDIPFEISDEMIEMEEDNSYEELENEEKEDDEEDGDEEDEEDEEEDDVNEVDEAEETEDDLEEEEESDTAIIEVEPVESDIREIHIEDLDDDDDPDSIEFSPIVNQPDQPVMREIPKPEIFEPEKPIVGQIHQQELTFNDAVGQSKTAETRFSNGPINSLRASIGLNDRFIFIREIFANNTDKYNTVIEKLDTLETIQEAVEYLKANLQMEKNETTMKFVDLLKRRFTK
jgi:hypothetical protein